MVPDAAIDKLDHWLAFLPPHHLPNGVTLKEKSNLRLIEAVVTPTSCAIDGSRDNGSTGVTDRKPAAAAESSPLLARP